MSEKQSVDEARGRLVEIAGRTSQDLGASRILGQVLIFLYLQEKECSLDQIAVELGLSKASVSIAARQLEHIGLIRQIWKPGDRRNYYATAENIVEALQEGLISQIRKKVQLFGEELAVVDSQLNCLEVEEKSSEVAFLKGRVNRARELQRKLKMFLDNPIVRFLSG